MIVPSAIGLSHLTRMLLIAHELAARDTQVSFAFNIENKLLKQYGFEVFLIPEVKIKDFSSNVFAAYSPSFVKQCVKDELTAIKTFQPDLIIGDFRHTAAISSRVAKIPYISVVNAYMTDFFNPVDVMIPKAERPFKHFWASLAAKPIQAIQKRALATHFRAVARGYGIKDLVSLYDFLKGDLTLIADVPEFCGLHKIPPNYRYIGPLIWEGLNGELPEFVADLNSSKKIIYATAGNTGSERLIELVFDAFKDDPSYEVVLTTGAFLNPHKLPPAKNIHIEKFIPGSKIMPHCRAVIHCGGNGTTYQALVNGRPSLVLPFNNDQRINAWLVKKNRVGFPCSPGAITGKHIRAMIDHLIQDADIQQNLQKFKQLLSTTDGPKSAAEHVMRFLANK
ncbi:MAG: hypothetical protein KDD04_00605 [Sinomicrobium sp.]|nr:hypothetical protein [Sinomicrobium sp.]